METIRSSSSSSSQVNTFLTNFQIFQNYFPWFESILPFFPKDKFGLTSEEIKEYRLNYERMYNIFILIPFKYKSDLRLSKGQTDKKIDKLRKKGPLIRDFFLMNMVRPDSKVKDLVHFLKGYVLVERLFPDLGFDPEFKKILTSRAYRSLFDVRFIREFFETGQMIHGETYLAPAHLLEELSKSYDNKEKTLFSIDQNLHFSSHLKEIYNNIGILYLGSPQMIDELIALFIDYYCRKILSKKKEIREFLLCFGEILKMCQGKSLIQFTWKNLQLQLETVTNKETVENFIGRVILERLSEPFYNSADNFDGWDFLHEYHNFLTKAGYYYLGQIYSGVFIVWRALIKYLEEIQKKEEFRIIKGSLLENWCYNQAISYKFNVEKLILINPKQEPDEDYSVMKSQTKDFPKESLEIEVEFPEKIKDFYSQEIDLALRIDKYLILFECKATSAPIGEQGDFIVWINNFHKNMRKLVRKADIINDNLMNSENIHPFLEKVKEIRVIQVQTEGIFYKYDVMNAQGYIRYLEDLRKHANKNEIDVFFHENLKESES